MLSSRGQSIRPSKHKVLIDCEHSTHKRITENSELAPWFARDSMEQLRRPVKRSIKLVVVGWLRETNNYLKTTVKFPFHKRVQFQSRCNHCGRWRTGVAHSHN